MYEEFNPLVRARLQSLQKRNSALILLLTLSGPTTVITSVEEELASYKSLRLSSAVSPLPFWQEHSRTYPILSTVARRVFAMSASSARSERDFSAVGRTVTDARSQLSASKVESIEILRWGLRAGLVNLD